MAYLYGEEKFIIGGINIMDEVWQIMIAGFGLVIASLQYKLSKQINKQDISREKGYFILEETNLRQKEAEDFKRFVGMFVLDNPVYPLRFRLYGNGDVFLLSEKIIIDGITVKNNEPLETFFSIYTQDTSIGRYGIMLPLRECDKKKPRLNIEIILKMKNIMGNVYIERIELEFERLETGREWYLRKRNTTFQSKS